MKRHSARAASRGPLVLLCLATVALAGSEALAEEIVVKYGGVIQGNPATLEVTGEEGLAGYALTPDGLREVQNMVAAGYLQVGEFIGITISQSGGEVVTAVRKADPGEEPPWARKGAAIPSIDIESDPLRDKIRKTITRGDQVEIVDVNNNTSQFIFELLDGSDLRLKTAGSKTIVVIPLASVRDIRKLEDKTGISTAGGPADNIAPGDFVEVTDANGKKFQGAIVSRTQKELELNAIKLDMRLTFDRAQMKGLRKLTNDEIALLTTKVETIRSTPNPNQTTSTTGAVKAPTLVHVRWDQPMLDAEHNVYTVTVTIHHELPEKLLVGTYIRVKTQGTSVDDEFQGDFGPKQAAIKGSLVAREEENKILDYFRARGIPTNRGVITYPVTGVQYYHLKIDERTAARTDDNTHLVEVGPARTDEKTIALGPMFPDQPAFVTYTTRELAPDVEVVEPLFEPHSFIPYDDPRAVSILIKTFDETKDDEDDALLRRSCVEAMGRSTDQRLIAFLFWHHYFSQRADPFDIEKAIAGDKDRPGRLRGAAEAWLLDRLEAGKWAEPFEVPTGAEGVADKREPKNPDTALASTLQILRAVETENEKAYRLAMQHVRNKSQPVRDAALALFIDRANPPLFEIIDFLSRPIVQAEDVLRALEKKRPGTLQYVLREILKDQDDGFLERIRPLEEAKRSEELVRRISELALSSGGQFVRKLVEGQAASGAVQSFLGELEVRRRSAAAGLVVRAQGSAPGHEDPRHWRTDLLRKALLLDRDNAAARAGLAAVMREIVTEVEQGSRLRVGPGDDYYGIELVKDGQIFMPAPDVPAQDQWIPVKHARGVSYLHAGSALTRPGGRAVLVRRASRAPEDVLKLVQQALTVDLDQEQRDRYEKVIVDRLKSIALDAAREGAWDRALLTYEAAAARKPSMQLRMGLLAAYLHTSPWVSVLGLIFFFMLLTSLIGWQKVPMD